MKRPAIVTGKKRVKEKPKPPPEGDKLTDVEQLMLALLGMANSAGKFALDVGFTGTADFHYVLEYLMIQDYFRLIDVTTDVAAAPGKLMKIFLLTAAGVSLRDTLAQRKKAFGTTGPDLAELQRQQADHNPIHRAMNSVRAQFANTENFDGILDDDAT